MHCWRLSRSLPGYKRRVLCITAGHVTSDETVSLHYKSNAVLDVQLLYVTYSTVFYKCYYYSRVHTIA